MESKGEDVRNTPHNTQDRRRSEGERDHGRWGATVVRKAWCTEVRAGSAGGGDEEVSRGQIYAVPSRLRI